MDSGDCFLYLKPLALQESLKTCMLDNIWQRMPCFKTARNGFLRIRCLLWKHPVGFWKEDDASLSLPDKHWSFLLHVNEVTSNTQVLNI